MCKMYVFSKLLSYFIKMPCLVVAFILDILFVPLPAASRSSFIFSLCFSYPLIQPFFSICLFLSVNSPISVIEIRRNNFNVAAWMQIICSFHIVNCLSVWSVYTSYLTSPLTFHKELDIFLILVSLLTLVLSLLVKNARFWQNFGWFL